jgi:hypothetical protein
MSKAFAIGMYCRALQEMDYAGINHVTVQGEIEPDRLKAFQKKFPAVKLALALDKKGLKNASEWKGVVKELTIVACKGMAVDKECQALLQHGFQVRVALPSDPNLLKEFELGVLRSMDVKLDIMAFDYAYPIAGCRTNFHTLLFAHEGPSIYQTLRFLQDRGIPLKKVNLGLANFGVVFKNVLPGIAGNGYLQPCEVEQSENPQMTPDAIKEYLKTHPAAQKFYTSFQGCFQSFIYNPDNGDWISFDDFTTLQSKIEWAQRHGLEGAFIKSFD